MAEPLKRWFGAAVVRRIAASISAVSAAFPARRFVAEATRGLERLELLERGRHVARALKSVLPGDYEEAVGILTASLGPELERTEGHGMDVFQYLPHVIFVADNGLDHFEASMHAQRELTRRFSAEFSIRAFLERDPQRTLARLAEWAADPNVHVRRLVSEGTRPRLPWAARLRAFQRDPRPVLALLERLKDDPEDYVRRSVANNLNDVAKDHPGLVLELCQRWAGDATAGRRWVIRHALRSLVKKGDPRALRLLGYRGGASVRIRGRVAPRRLRIGQTCRVEITVENASRRPQSVVVDLAVYFVKANGGTRAKVFKVRSLRLPPLAQSRVAKAVSFAQRTTRRHYPGRHRIEARVNGRAVPIGQVEVRA